MALAGNLTTVTVEDSDLTARFPTLLNYIPPDQTDWAAQIAEGKKEALRAFRTSKAQDPEFAQALEDDDWKSIIVDFTLWVVLKGFVQEDFRQLAREWRSEGLDRLGELLYRYDADLDGSLDDNSVLESDQRVSEVRLTR
jgi:hypothetical protein